MVWDLVSNLKMGPHSPLQVLQEWHDILPPRSSFERTQDLLRRFPNKKWWWTSISPDQLLEWRRYSGSLPKCSRWRIQGLGDVSTVLINYRCCTHVQYSPSLLSPILHLHRDRKSEQQICYFCRPGISYKALPRLVLAASRLFVCSKLSSTTVIVIDLKNRQPHSHRPFLKIQVKRVFTRGIMISFDLLRWHRSREWVCLVSERFWGWEQLRVEEHIVQLATSHFACQ